MAFSTAKQEVRLMVLLACLLLILGVAACQINPGPATPGTPGISEPLPADPNRNYQILSVKFAGIPVENVRINQLARTITVSIPAGFVGDDLKPVVTLTENTTLVAGLGSEPNRPFRLVSFCYCNTLPTALIKPVGATSNQAGAQYAIIAESLAPLAPKQPTTPLIVPLSEITTISLQVDNPYGTLVVAAYVQPVNGGTPILIQGNFSRTSGCVVLRCDPKEPEQLRFTFNPAPLSSLVAGDYLLILEQQNGTRLTQRIRFVRGEMRVEVNPFFGYTVNKGANSFGLSGSNLFADEITGVLKAPNGQTWNLKPVSSAPNGTALTVGLPTDLEPGYYSFQLSQNNVVYRQCFRLSVRQSSSHPTLMSVSVDGSCLKTSPVTVKRGVNYTIAYSGSNSAQLKLISITDPAKTYLVPLTYPIESFPKFNLPDTVTPGTYRAVVQNNATSQSLESEPFEQPVIVQ